MIKLKNILKESKTPVREGYSTEEKRIVMMAVRKIAKYMNRDPVSYTHLTLPTKA